MKKNLTHECQCCGAIVSDAIMQSIQAQWQQAEDCPFCRNAPDFTRSFPTRPKKAFDCIVNNRRGDIVESVFVEFNKVSNPRLVIRLHDDYLRSWDNSKFPEGFTLIRTCDARKERPPCPIELVFHFNVDDVSDNEVFSEKVSNALDVFIAWADKRI